MSGGKGGTTTQRQEIPEWQKKEIMEAIQKSKDMNIPYSPYMGVDVVAQAKGINDNLNLGLSAFGMNPMQSVLPEAVEQGGLRGFRSFDMYQDTMNRFKEEYPDIFRRIEGLTAETTTPQTMDVMQPAMNNAGMMNPVTGMPIVPETSQPGYESMEDYARQIEASKIADTSGRLRTFLEDDDPYGYVDPLKEIFGGSNNSYNMNRD
tara:strand:+ start:1240 stop:1857 length:618 start_codon:yes stop_codon:yes gene_type:complete